MTFPNLERPGQAHVDLRTSYAGMLMAPIVP